MSIPLYLRARRAKLRHPLKAVLKELAFIADDAGGSIDAAREKLVDQCAAHIDIAKDNAIQRVVEHHIQAF